MCTGGGRKALKSIIPALTLSDCKADRLMQHNIEKKVKQPSNSLLKCI